MDILNPISLHFIFISLIISIVQTINFSNHQLILSSCQFIIRKLMTSSYNHLKEEEKESHQPSLDNNKRRGIENEICDLIFNLSSQEEDDQNLISLLSTISKTKIRSLISLLKQSTILTSSHHITRGNYLILNPSILIHQNQTSSHSIFDQILDYHDQFLISFSSSHLSSKHFNSSNHNSHYRHHRRRRRYNSSHHHQHQFYYQSQSDISSSFNNDDHISFLQSANLISSPNLNSSTTQNHVYDQLISLFNTLILENSNLIISSSFSINHKERDLSLKANQNLSSSSSKLSHQYTPYTPSSSSSLINKSSYHHSNDHYSHQPSHPPSHLPSHLPSHSSSSLPNLFSPHLRIDTSSSFDQPSNKYQPSYHPNISSYSFDHETKDETVERLCSSSSSPLSKSQNDQNDQNQISTPFRTQPSSISSQSNNQHNSDTAKTSRMNRNDKKLMLLSESDENQEDVENLKDLENQPFLPFLTPSPQNEEKKVEMFILTPILKDPSSSSSSRTENMNKFEDKEKEEENQQDPFFQPNLNFSYLFP